MVPSKPTGCRIRIKPAIGLSRRPDFRADVKATATIACGALLRRTVDARARQLGRGSEVTDYRLEAYDDTTGSWIEHAP